MSELNRRDTPWKDEANCRDSDPEMFFPGASKSLEKAAKEICSKCVVRNYCRAEAMSDSRIKGVWGGTTERERKKEFKRSANQAQAQARRNKDNQL